MSDSTVPERYKYDDIQSEGWIRLLSLSPSSDQNESAMIRCNLELQPFSADILYEALSYTWGDGEADHQILIDDNVFSVSRSLYFALRELRLGEQKRVLWIDAICINQSNGVEKGHQVSQMGQIYSRAEQVIVWLGEGDDVSDLGMKTLCQIFDVNLELYSSPNTKYTVPEAFKASLYWLLARENLEQRLLGLIKIYDRSWFDRVWILQEIILAKRAVVLFGKGKIPWSDFEMFAGIISSEEFNTLLRSSQLESQGLSETLGLLLGALWGTAHIGLMKEKISKNDMSLEELLPKTLHLEATCTVDKIYALLGLCTDTYGVYPDYSLSLSKCCCTTWKTILLKTGSISLLGYQCVEPRTCGPLPTWVPAIDLESYDITLTISAGFYSLRDSLYQAAPNSIPAFIEFKDDDTILVLRGLICGSIVEMGDQFPGMIGDSMKIQPGSSIPLVYQAQGMTFKRRGRYANGDTLGGAFWRTMTLDLEKGGYHSECKSNRRLLKSDKNFPPATTQEVALLIKAIDGSCMFSPSIVNKRFFVTRGGYIGFCPIYTQIGDILCVFLGAATPFVLREVSEQRYEMIGQCYMHGIMDGEAFEMAGGDCIYQDFAIQ